MSDQISAHLNGVAEARRRLPGLVAMFDRLLDEGASDREALVQTIAEAWSDGARWGVTELTIQLEQHGVQIGHLVYSSAAEWDARG